MKKSLDFLNDLLPVIDAFVESRNRTEISLDSFTLYLNQKLLSEETTGGNHSKNDSSRKNIDGHLLFLLFFICRLTTLYAKRALAKIDFVNVSDYHFLLTLLHKGDMRKSELVHLNITELPSGIDVINRLIRNKLIKDYPDPEDRRSKRVTLTAKGRQVINKMKVEMGKVSHIIPADLTNNQRVTLLTLLNQLYNFHFNAIQLDSIP